MERSILDLSTEELILIKESGKLSENITLSGIEERKDFDQLYRHRNNPAILADLLLKNAKREQGVRGLSQEEKDAKVALERDRIALKKAEIELRQEKTKGQTAILKDLKSQLIRLETKLDLIVREILHTKASKKEGE